MITTKKEEKRTLACVSRVVLPPMGTCNRTKVDVNVDGFVTVPRGSEIRYTFEFPSNTGTEKNLTLDPFPYQQCALVDGREKLNVSITSGGVPVNLRGDMTIDMILFHDYDIGAERDYPSTLGEAAVGMDMRREMEDHRERMKREDLDFRRRFYNPSSSMHPDHPDFGK